MLYQAYDIVQLSFIDQQMGASDQMGGSDQVSASGADIIYYFQS